MRIQVGPADIAACRYAVSPLIEAMSALRMLAGLEAAGPLGPVLARLRPQYETLRRDPAVGTLVALFRHRGYNADFIQPPPARVGLTFAEELAAVRATPLRRARSEIARNLAGHRTPPAYARRILDAPDVVDRLADGIEAVWAALVEPQWPRLRAILDRDVVQRAGRLAAYGWAAALTDLDPRLRWHSAGPTGTIEVRVRDRASYRLGGRGLLFMPTVFGSFITYVEPPWPYAIVYPARGTADLLAPADPARPRDALDRLIGTSRAAVLRALAVPATTSQLVAQLGLALGTVGDHLAALHAAGLVTRTRVGHAVRYERNAIGDALAAG
jgi:DNA-binding transcriptional ArsR family regulator